ncbi:MAG: hypothetical protein Q9166_005390 [cf. Caloplaca sp. 2 TL-2023]
MSDLPYSIATLVGQFDIIFVDANKDGYLGYVKAILDRRLLSPHGVIVCDNGEYIFARGMTISTSANPELDNRVRPYWTECGKALRKFNEFVVNDPRVDVTMLPLFDGISLIKWKLDVASGGKRGHVVGGVANGVHADNVRNGTGSK